MFTKRLSFCGFVWASALVTFVSVVGGKSVMVSISLHYGDTCCGRDNKSCEMVAWCVGSVFLFSFCGFGGLCIDSGCSTMGMDICGFSIGRGRGTRVGCLGLFDGVSSWVWVFA
jgi:hypothetical protein